MQPNSCFLFLLSFTWLSLSPIRCFATMARHLLNFMSGWPFVNRHWQHIFALACPFFFWPPIVR
ncbi:hypothetical protein BC940DRAFT_304646 [Gongronella butleri]|nr:hypothetical protein BC940DRAFT_304646 [Gongronella butleri]